MCVWESRGLGLPDSGYILGNLDKIDCDNCDRCNNSYCDNNYDFRPTCVMCESQKFDNARCPDNVLDSANRDRNMIRLGNHWNVLQVQRHSSGGLDEEQVHVPDEQLERQQQLVGQR